VWQFGKHRLLFGVDWQHNRNGGRSWANEPATIALYSPGQARQAGLTPPAEYRTLDDILALPLRTVTVAVGDPSVPQANGSSVRTWDTARLFVQDTWQVSSRVAVNYGLAWSMDRNLNYDLSKPALLAPIFGADGLGPTKRDWKNFAPSLGSTWTPSSDRKTVVRFGAGLFYDFLFPAGLDGERVALGPPGLGRQTFQGASIPNSLPGVPGVPVGTPLDFRRPTLFTGANFMTILPEIRENLLQTSQNADLSVRQIEVTKTANGLSGSSVPTASALHINAGVQRQLARNFFVNADFAFKRFNHFPMGGIDSNHFRSVTGPVIPACLPAERNDPQALCSNGPISTIAPVGRAAYVGSLLRADKRFSDGSQILASWAFSRTTGTNPPGTNGFNVLNWHENRGPLETDYTHILNVAGVRKLPSDFSLGFNFSYQSAPPFNPFVGGIDFNGDGTTGDLLPGTTVNAFNRGTGTADLERLVTQFNQTYPGQTDAAGAAIPSITLPAQYMLGDNFHALDLRLSRSFPWLDGRMTLKLTGDVFNVYNTANVSGHSGDLTNAATFGQPTARFNQVFGSGGPRAFQFGARVSF
jgi:hypothetical protein